LPANWPEPCMLSGVLRMSISKTPDYSRYSLFPGASRRNIRRAKITRSDLSRCSF